MKRLKATVSITIFLLIAHALEAKPFKTYEKVHNRAVKAYNSLGKSQVGWQLLGYSVKKRKIYFREFGSGEDVLLVIGGIHGDEPGAMLTVIKFGEYMNMYPELLTGHVVLIPCINPDGLMRWSRTNANGVDINRNFPSHTWTGEYTKSYNNPGPYPASEPETVLIMNTIYEYMPWLIIQMHQPFGAIFPSRGAPEKLYTAMSVKSGFDIKFDIGYSTPGSIGSFADTQFLKIPGITFEMGSIYQEPDYCRVVLSLLDAANYRPGAGQ